jgi:hypothetical protein
MRRHYWSCSRLADRLRGTEKLNAGTSAEWRKWEKDAKQAHPIRFWIAEELLDRIQNTVHYIPDKLYDIKYYINNRWVSRTHCLTADPSHIKPGQWRDLGNRFLPCLFNELVNFVEVELAWKHIAWDEEAQKKYRPPFWAWGWFRWRTWRSAQAGLDYLAWEKTLIQDETWGLEPGDENYGKPAHQAERAQEIEELYRWWKEVYPSRPDPHDVSGWSELCSRQRDQGRLAVFDHENETEEEREEFKKSLDVIQEIEKQYREEDEKMLIKLIKMRESLWT